MTLQDATALMSRGGEVFRTVGRHRYFYQIREGILLCRCNELGGWHKSIGGLRDTDTFSVSIYQGQYNNQPPEPGTRHYKELINRQGAAKGTPNEPG